MKRKRNAKGLFLKGRAGGAVKRRKRSRRVVRRNPPPARRFGRARRAASAAGAAGLRVFGVSLPPLRTLAVGAAGMAAVRLAPNMIAARLPSVPTVGPAGIAVRALVALLGGRLVASVAGAQAGKDFTLGGMLSVADEVVSTYVVPSVGLSAYLEPGAFGSMGAYLGPGVEAGYLPAGSGMSGLPTRLDTAARFG